MNPWRASDRHRPPRVCRRATSPSRAATDSYLDRAVPDPAIGQPVPVRRPFVPGSNGLVPPRGPRGAAGGALR